MDFRMPSHLDAWSNALGQLWTKPKLGSPKLWWATTLVLVPVQHGKHATLGNWCDTKTFVHDAPVRIVNLRIGRNIRAATIRTNRVVSCSTWECEIVEPCHHVTHPCGEKASPGVPRPGSLTWLSCQRSATTQEQEAESPHKLAVSIEALSGHNTNASSNCLPIVSITDLLAHSESSSTTEHDEQITPCRWGTTIMSLPRVGARKDVTCFPTRCA